MISARARKQLTADVSNFFGTLRDYSQQTDKYNLGLGEISCRNKLLNEFENHSDKVMKNITRLTRHYPGTQGYLPLNEKLAELIKLETGREVSPEEIVLTNGAYDAISHAIFTYADISNKVAFPVPSFPYWGNTVRTSTFNNPLLCRTPEDYSHNIARLVREGTDSNVQLLILNNPHNPLGVSISKSQALELDDFVCETDMKIVLDDVYRAFNSEKWVGHHFEPEHVITVDSLSKRFGLPGLRLGFVHLPKEEVKFFRASLANHYVGVNMASVVLADSLLELFLNEPKLNNIPGIIARRQEELDSSLRKIKGVNSPKPKGGMFRLMYCNNPLSLQKKLADNNVIVKPSDESFPEEVKDKPGFVRLSVGGEHRIKQAVEKIREVTEKNGVL